ncbi:MAG: hypothetical protein AB7S70_04015 [Hyphomicrobium sp.]|uniref:hypothetical protein n=1 Tax=Hyphomicrobium sp. TaxID=82 RepID=UPI003D14DE3C
MTNKIAASSARTSDDAGSGLWIALIAGLSVIGSYGLACVAPLAAVAALAALTLRRTEGLVLVVATWLVNQAVGFLLLSYPHTPDTYGWGVAIGVATLAGYLAAAYATSLTRSPLAAIVAAFAASFATYQAWLYLFGVATGYAGDSFSLPVVGEVLGINAVAYVAFLVLHRAAVALSIARPMREPSAVTA